MARRQDCQVAAELAISQGCGQAGGQVSQELANPLAGMTDASEAV
jgi:hypothetical protein